jgi:TonB family protein
MYRRQVRSLAAIACLALLWHLPHAEADDLQQHLRDQYQNKMFVFRAPNSGNSLHFDSAGHLLEGSAGEDWTTDSVVQVEDLKVSRQHLEVRARRLHLVWVRGSGLQEAHDFDRNRQPDKDEKKNRSVRIVADLKTSDAGAVDTTFAQIFLVPRDSFADLLPSYWKPCVRAALGDDDGNKFPACRFSATLLAVPGIALHPNQPTNDRSDADSGTTSQDRVLRVAKGVTPPKLSFNPEPEYSDPARIARVQGTVTLELVVSREGLPSNIRIVSPIGCGLDAKAVHAVENWKFNPAEKDGEPVAVDIAVEVDFHLY